MKIKNSFDADTLRSILNSFILTFISAVGVFFVALSQGTGVGTAALISVGTVGAFLVNAPREYLKGTDQEKKVIDITP